MKYKIGIDLGGTNIAAGIVDEENKIVKKASVPTSLPRPAKDIAASIAGLVEGLLNETNIEKNDVLSLGIGTPGAVNNDGIIENDANLGFINVPLKDMVQELSGIKTYIGNDANCAALGEQVAGCGKGTKNFIAITLGTGIGGGIVLDGKLLTGVNGAGGEIGHMIIDHQGVPCKCGNIGCFEQYASATALISQTKEALLADSEKKSKMWELIENDLEKVTGKTAFDAAKMDDLIALEVVDTFVEYLSTGVTNLINIFQPEMICIGGGVSAQGDNLIKPLMKKVEQKRYTKYSKKQTKICVAVLGNDAGIIGAANLK